MNFCCHCRAIGMGSPRIQIQCSGTALAACAFRCTAKQALSLLCIEAQSMRIRGSKHCSAAALLMLHHIGVIRVPVDRHLGYAAAPECTHSALVLVAVRCHAAKSGHVRPSARLGRAVHHHGLCETVHSCSVRIHGGGYGKDPAHDPLITCAPGHIGDTPPPEAPPTV